MEREPVKFERFVPADVAADYLGISKRHLQELARKGLAGSYPIGTGDFRKRWVFLLSELTQAIKGNSTSIRKPPQPSYDLKISGRSSLK